jgi:hypothetical protein
MALGRANHELIYANTEKERMILEYWKGHYSGKNAMQEKTELNYRLATLRNVTENEFCHLGYNAMEATEILLAACFMLGFFLAEPGHGGDMFLRNVG